ncbi:MAG: YIP1 family protein [Rhodobacterales bacterium]|nr:YIP1 family protein [Rhodobacterales bacterium]
MPITRDIVATYRGPGRVVRRILGMGAGETYALTLVMVGCVVVFIAQWPKFARESYLSGEDIYISLYGAFIAMMFMMPLVLYALAGVSHVVARLIGGTGSGYASRVALFWAFLAASPMMLLNGLVAGFIGAGPQMTVTGGLWLLVFLWFWLMGLREAQWGKS